MCLEADPSNMQWFWEGTIYNWGRTWFGFMRNAQADNLEGSGSKVIEGRELPKKYLSALDRLEVVAGWPRAIKRTTGMGHLRRGGYCRKRMSVLFSTWPGPCLKMWACPNGRYILRWPMSLAYLVDVVSVDLCYHFKVSSITCRCVFLKYWLYWF